MAILITMPSLSPTMESGQIALFRKSAGDFLEPGDVLAEIETDKAVVEYEMVDEGYLREILVSAGETLAVGTPIAILAESMDEDISSVLKSQAATSPAAATKQVPPPETPTPASNAQVVQVTGNPKLAPAEATLPAHTQQPSPTPAVRAPNEQRLRVSPYARKLATEQQVNLQHVQGSGPAGRIIAADIETATRQLTQLPQHTHLSHPQAGSVDMPLSMIRKTIARRLVESKQTAPHYQVRRKIRAEALLAAREQILQAMTQENGVRISVNDLLIKATALSLAQHPEVNSQFTDAYIRQHHDVHIAVAVATDEGLTTPVIRHANHKGLTAISEEMRALAKKAKDKKLQPQDYEGGTFTISNLGMFGVHEFNAIINPPQAAILAVSAIVDEAVVEEGVLKPGKAFNCTLSSDHRAIDGAMAARFMQTLVQRLEKPFTMLL